MSTYSTSTLQKRKSSKTKSKQQQQAEASAAADSVNANAAAAANAVALAVAAAAAAAAAAQNERLQRSAFSDKLDALRLRSTTPASTLLPCNGIGTIVNCCRDINCRLNAPQTSAASFAAAESVMTQRSSSCISERSNASAAASNFSSSSGSTTSALPPSTPPPPRDGSPDSGMGSDSGGVGLSAACAPLLQHNFTVSLRVDLLAWALFVLAFCTRFYKLTMPPNVVFDELHYGKYISLYMRNIFFFDQHPPLGKQLIAAVAHAATGYDGNYTFPRIGADYDANVPIFWLRFVPALCGSALAPAVYKLLLEARLTRASALLGGLLVVLDNALLTQSRFVLMESMLLLFSTLGLCALLRFQRCRFSGAAWVCCGTASAVLLTCAASVKYAGFLTSCLAAYLMCRFLWQLLYDARVSDMQVVLQTVGRVCLFTVIPLLVYLGVFYIHLQTLHRAGPHDSVMTSAFQASLDGGLASITRGQPLKVVHGSQITLRHTHGRTCWLHSHAHVYPVRYPDKRGSSHQQQVTCYSFKDVNNWWIVKRPQREDLVVGDVPDPIRHGDKVQLVHGITSRALNSHDVAAPMTPQCQEVTCYIDYQIKMEGELLWRVEILNKDTEGPIWHAIKSEIRLIHVSTGAALRFTGRQLPDWGFNQHEVAADRVTEHQDAIWNVEEHRYTKTEDQRERERQMLNAEMIPTRKTRLSFWEKFVELQLKMFSHAKQQTPQSHMYSSEPHEWPMLEKGIAYWVDGSGKTNSQIHLLGNVLIWWTGSAAVLIYATLGVFYLLRRQRQCYDLPPREWQRFLDAGDIFFVGYLLHYLPYFFMDRTLFLHHYLPAFLFKLLLLCFVIEHLDYLLRRYCSGSALWPVRVYRLAVLVWLGCVLLVFMTFLPLSYGIQQLSVEEVIGLRWRDTWDLILQKNAAVGSTALN